MNRVTTISDLDGNYSITYQADAPPLDIDWYDHTQASATITNGKLSGRDVGGAEWEADFTLLPEESYAEFKAIVSAKNAPASTFILDKNGQPTRNSQVYTGKLKVTSIGTNLAVHGIVNHGVVNITVILRRK